MLQTFTFVLASALKTAFKLIALYSLTIPFVAIPAVIQEKKIWKNTPTPLSPWGILKVYLFNIVWMVIALLASISLLPMWISRGCGRSVEMEAHAVMEYLDATLLVKFLVGEVEVIGKENLPKPPNVQKGEVAPVYVANHCSQLDVAVVYFCLTPFKWIAKKSVMFLPGVGQIMSLSGHVFIQRTGKNSTSVSSLFALSNKAVQEGKAMMIFPQGTRRMTEKLPFKNGAYIIALENKCKLVPVTINVPLGIWNASYPLNFFNNNSTHDESKKIVITIHKPIDVKDGMDKEDLKKQTMDVIYSKLPPLYHGKGANGDEIKGKND
mmetsp:Transcript_19248/g.27071  ORF Transcript_19248/g.27071 Transcript_19248/m.27071 type:complete len:323 (-) Transcript_19248:263-1231(-)|eukprot:CAMPEP_0184856936 /NCGR_PEP_ID=MMETSP0580-20130426/2099_1 /TAXON_ID=1118495 /ORGANISM="Dactyliosolen fragilissimus" /LENGTH=322 /DNA_ID=CAMNT_0027352229 /DNA_START=79 /DNA_END=1047 /DNA_ORIENTATION=+